MARTVKTKPTQEGYDKGQGVLEVESKPFRSYIKTILGKVHVIVLDTYSNEPTSVILSGDPRSDFKEGSIIDTWNESGDKYLRINNKPHFETGTLIPYVRTEFNVVTEEEVYNSKSDEELRELLSSPYFEMLSVLQKITAVGPIYRLLTLAKEMDKSEKTVGPIQRRLEEIQAKEYNYNLNSDEVFDISSIKEEE